VWSRVYRGIKGALLTIRSVRGRGLGLFVLSRVLPFDPVVEYSGECVESKKEMDRLEKEYEAREQGYLMAREGGGGVDATHVGGVGRYANHGCVGTCQLKNVGGKLVLCAGAGGLWPEDEVTYNYGCGEGDDRKCKCRDVGCRKVY
jgi:hypothetical protein